MTKNRTKSKILKKIILLKSLLSSFLILCYFLSISFSNPLFLIQDIQNKKGQVKGIFLSVDVSGAPNEPIINASSTCQEKKALVNLSWQEDDSVINYEIIRNGSTLISGLTQNSYQDDTVFLETNYTYQIIAYGQLHNATSQEVSITTPNCEAVPIITCQMTLLNDKSLLQQTETIKIRDRTPDFTGTTSFPNAIINLTISGTSNVSATTQASESGYWHWLVPEKLDQGQNTITVFSQDPSSSLVSESYSLTFEIEETASQEKTESDSNTEIEQNILHAKKKESDQGISTSKEIPLLPFELKLKINNLSNTVYTGNYLTLTNELTPQKMNFGSSILKYTVTNKKGEILIQKGEPIEWDKEKKIWEKKILIPEIFPQGEYQVNILTQIDNVTIASSQSFLVKETPVFQVGKQEISLPFLFNIVSWTILILLTLIIFLSLILLLEIYLSQKANFDINGKILKRFGYFSKKKGGA